MPCRIVSAGGLGSYQYTAEIPGVTEMQAGGGVFACRYYTEVCHVDGHRPAIAVLATVVGRPPGRSGDPRRRPEVDQRLPDAAGAADHPGCRVLGLSAEHATVEVGPGESLSIGDKVRVIPGYSDFTFVLHDRVLGHRRRAGRGVLAPLGAGHVAVSPPVASSGRFG